jgi:PBP1b-binding outer membrane lipoprotein LpoB
MKIKSLFSIIIVVLFFTSCSKELSLEQGGNLELVGAPSQQFMPMHGGP